MASPAPRPEEQVRTPGQRSRPVSPPVTHPGRTGFLPIATNAFDRGFIAVVLFVAINLLWMRFLEPHGLHQLIAVALATVVGVVIVWRG